MSARQGSRPYWVFGYGSLMWDPGFPHEEARPATLFGYHRSFCVYSIRYRGTELRPGLVLGLDRGGSCVGVAYRIADADIAQARRYLWDREMLHNVYIPRMAPMRLLAGEPDFVDAQTFVVDRAHRQYTG